MTNVVIIDDVKESDIRPGKTMRTLSRLLQGDLRLFLGARPTLTAHPCPGCGAAKREPAFKKMGVAYVRCARCQTLFVSPRPSAERLADFYGRSRAVRFWNSSLGRKVENERDAHIYLPRLDWLSATVRRHFKEPVAYGDLRPKYETLLRRIARTPFFNALYGLEAEGPARPSLEDAGYRTPPGSAAEAARRGVRLSVLTAFEVIERAHDPRRLVLAARDLLEDGGLFLATTRAGSGFDLQVLWDKTENLLPLIHLNLLSIEGAERLLEKTGFDVLELSTPGRLDVEIVRQAVAKDPGIPLHRFLKYLIGSRDLYAHQAFQEFLQAFRLSSHLRLVARKRTRAKE